MKVSLITPFYNGSKYVRECILNIQEQKFCDFEHVIVDDGSLETESSILLDASQNFSNIKIIHKNNSGQASAINKGLQHIQGEYVTFCDQDDWWLSDKLEKQTQYLNEHKDIDLVYSDAYIGTEDGMVTKKTWMQWRKVSPREGGYRECVADLFKRNFICAPLVVMIRRSALEKVGGINERFTSAYDYDLWFRLLESGSRFGYITEPLAVWRSHAQNESRNIHKAKRMQFKILTAFLKRNSSFIIKHPLLVFSKYIRMVAAFIISFDPYK